MYRASAGAGSPLQRRGKKVRGKLLFFWIVQLICCKYDVTKIRIIFLYLPGAHASRMTRVRAEDGGRSPRRPQRVRRRAHELSADLKC